MASKRDIAKFNKRLLNGLKENKEQVEKALKIFDDFYADCDTRGMAIIDRLSSTQGDKTLIFEIEQWREEREKNLFDYSFVIVNGDGEVILDGADGELPLPSVLQRFKDKQRKLSVFLC